MKFKIGNMKAKDIVNKILLLGLICFIIVVLNMISEFFLLPGTTGESLVVKIYGFMQIISFISIPIIGLILLKLLCEVLYKLVRACEIIIERYDNK